MNTWGNEVRVNDKRANIPVRSFNFSCSQHNNIECHVIVLPLFFTTCDYVTMTYPYV